MLILNLILRLMFLLIKCIYLPLTKHKNIRLNKCKHLRLHLLVRLFYSCYSIEMINGIMLLSICIN